MVDPIAGSTDGAQPTQAPELSSPIYRLGVEASPSGLLMAGVSGKIIMVNRQIETMFGYRRDEILGKRVEILIPPRFHKDHPESMRRFFENPKSRLMGGGQRAHLTGIRKDGTEFPIEIGLNPCSEGGAKFVLASIIDTSERRARDKELSTRVVELQRNRRESTLLSEMSSLLQHAVNAHEAHGIVARFGELLIPCTGSIDTVSVFLTRASRDGLTREASWGKSDGPEHFGIEDCWALRRSQSHCTAPREQGASPLPDCGHTVEGTWSMCLPMSAHGQCVGLISISGTEPISEADLSSLERTGKAIADQVAMAISNLNLRDSLNSLAVRDPLTGLFNRRHMEATAAREIARAKRDEVPLSILMIDVDHFKRFNDTRGHQAADEVLKGLGSKLRGRFRESDIACRYGGEEFLVVLPVCARDDALAVGEALREEIATGPLEITVSMGVAAFPGDGQSWDAVLRRADDALYEAKRAGRNQVRVSERPANGAPLVGREKAAV